MALINRRALHRIFVALMGLIPFTVTALIFFYVLQHPSVSDEEVEEARSICSSISVPESFAKADDYNIVKSGLALFGTAYSSSEDPRNVEDFFTNTLSQKGWTYKKESDFSPVQLVFQKGKFSVVIVYEALSFTSEHKYSVSCSIGIRKVIEK